MMITVKLVRNTYYLASQVLMSLEFFVGFPEYSVGKDRPTNISMMPVHAYPEPFFIPFYTATTQVHIHRK